MKAKHAMMLILPALALLVFVFIIPLFFLASKSFQGYIPGSLFTNPEFTLENYLQLFKDTYYIQIIWRTVKIAIICTAIIFVLSYPVAIFASKMHPRFRGFFMTLILLPMIGGAMIQTLGWFAALMRYGIINEVLQRAHILKAAINFLGTEKAVYIGLIQAFLPLFIYPLTSSLIAIDQDILSAAKTLGAKRGEVFFKLTLPLSMPGAISGTALTFMACLTCFVTPTSLGQGKIQVFGTFAYQQAMLVMNWPFTAAFCIGFLILLVITVVAANMLMKAMKAAKK